MFKPDMTDVIMARAWNSEVAAWVGVHAESLTHAVVAFSSTWAECTGGRLSMAQREVYEVRFRR